MEKPKSCESAIKIVGNELLTLNMLTTQKKCLFLHLCFSYLKENLLNSKTNADMGWTLLEYLLKHKATRSGSSTSQKYHCNGLEFDNPADMEDYKNAQGLK